MPSAAPKIAISGSQKKPSPIDPIPLACKSCGEPIDQGAVRVALGREVSFGTQVRVAPVNVHPACVAAEMNGPECVTEPEGLGEALRENSKDVPSDRIEALLAEIGDLSGS